MGSETEVLETEETSITETEIETLSEEGAGTVPVYAVDPEGGFELFVESLAGSPYESGGEYPEGFDDTGFVVYCFKKYYAVHLHQDMTAMSESGEEINPDEIQPCDVVFFDKDDDGVMDHCGIYVGDGTYVHAQSTESCVIVSDYADAEARVGSVRRIVYGSGEITGEGLG